MPFFWLILIAFIVSLVTRRIRIPYPLALVITGLAIGLPRLLPQAHLDPTLLFTVFLPPLLFDSAIKLPFDSLRRDAVTVSIYTLLGTVASTMIVAGLTTLMLHLPFATSMVFGALISTTDPISIIAIFKRLGAGKRLTLIMEAESLLNNGVAAVLFAVAVAIATGAGASATGSVFLFARLFIGGILVGLIIAAAASRIHYELDDHLVEITLTTVVAYGSYLCAEALGLSGVMASVAAGLVIGNFGMPATMSPGTRLAVSAFWDYAAFVTNSVVFLLIGIEVSYVRLSDSIPLAAAAVAAVLVGRATVYPLSLLVNRLGGNIPLSWQHVLWWGGLRGALSMALVLGLAANFPYRGQMIVATFSVVLFSLLVQGLTIGPVLQALGLAGTTKPQGSPGARRLAADVTACRAAVRELERVRAAESHSVWSVELLLHEYRDRLSALETSMAAIEPQFQANDASVKKGAIERVLLAEKDAYRDAMQEGLLTEGDWGQIAARIDKELIELQGSDREPDRAPKPA